MEKKNLNINITWKSLKLLFHSSPIMCLLFLMFEGLLSVIPILSAKIISEIVTTFTQDFGDTGIDYLILIVTVYILMNVMVQIITPIRSLITEGLSEKIARDSELMLNQKIISFQTLNCFEEHEFYNELKLARDGCGVRLISSLQMISSLMRGMITICLTTGYLLSIHVAIGLVSLIALVPVRKMRISFWS